jgi:hypothetical protein
MKRMGEKNKNKRNRKQKVVLGGTKSQNYKN